MPMDVIPERRKLAIIAVSAPSFTDLASAPQSLQGGEGIAQRLVLAHKRVMGWRTCG